MRSAPQPCAETGVILHGFVDGELDAVHALDFERHLAECPDCTREVARIRRLRGIVAQDGVRWRAPDHLRARILDAVAREGAADRSARRSPHGLDVARLFRAMGRWSLVPSLGALAATLFLVFAAPQDRTGIERDVVASHVRSMLVDHLTDVETSDQHTVKPWFGGKVDFSPPVADLTARGFALVGGRLDYVAGRVVAALVYRRHEHVINVFVWPAAPGAELAESRDGFNLVRWSGGGLTFWAVSDLEAKELSLFSRLMIGSSP